MRQFKFMGLNVSVTDEREEYNNIRGWYVELGENARKQFRENFVEIAENAYENRDLSVIGEYWKDYVISVMDSSIAFLIDNEIYDIDKETYYNIYSNLVYDLDSKVDELEENFNEIWREVSGNEQYRSERLRNRSRLEGTGIGVGASIAGMATAGLANAVTGTFHAAVNAINNARDIKKANEEINELIHSDYLIDKFSVTLYLSILHMHFVTLRILKDNGFDVSGFVTPEDERKAKNILNNLENNSFDKSREIKLINEVLNLNPYQKSIYEYTIKKFGDRNLELQNIADFFKVDIEWMKEEQYLNVAKEIKIDSKKDLEISREKLTNKMEFLNCRDFGGYLEYINESLNKREKEERTVDGLLYNSVEEAQKAREELAKIKQIIKGINNDSIKILEEKLDKLTKEFDKRVSKKYVMQIKGNITELEKKERTVDGLLYNSIEEAQEAREELAKIKQIIKGINNDSMEILEEKLNKLTRGFNEKLSKKYVMQIEKRMTNLDKEERTVDGVLYNSIERAKYERKKSTEKKALDRLIEGLDTYSKEELIKKLTLIKSKYDSEMSVSYINKINNRLYEIDKKERTVEDIVFDDIDTANIAKREVEELYRLMQDMDNIDVEKITLKNLYIIRKRLISYDAKTIIRNKYLKMLDSMIEENRKKHIKAKEEFRNGVIGSIFISIIGGYFINKVGNTLKYIIIGVIAILALGIILQINEVRQNSKYLRKINKQTKKMKKNNIIFEI